VDCGSTLLLQAFPPERPHTFANPINIDYRFMIDLPSRREAADPAIVIFGDDYYLFASKSGGYWHSRDMVDWTFVTPTGLPIEAYDPAVMVLNGALYHTARNIGLYKSSDPKSGKWEFVSKTFDVGDPDRFADDDGRVYLRRCRVTVGAGSGCLPASGSLSGSRHRRAVRRARCGVLPRNPGSVRRGTQSAPGSCGGSH
jgi:beta-xylosidase